MADKHPYVTSPGPLIQVVNHLRNTFPASLTADTLRKLGYAPKNESYIISTLRFLGVIDEDGNKTEPGGKTFSLHGDKDFQQGFERLVKEAYKGLFGLHGDKAWSLDTGQLITFFRQNDQSSAIVGKRQASTFMALAGIAGHRDIAENKASQKANKNAKPKKHSPTPKTQNARENDGGPRSGSNAGNRDVGLTVRIEINLPAEATQDTYNRIFKSIRENLLNG
jgi:hypothetical protein